MRVALRNGDLVRFALSHVTSHLAAGVMSIAALVYAFSLGGSFATAATSMVLLIAHVLAAPYAGAIVRRRPYRARLAAFATQAIMFGAAAAAAAASAPAAVVAGPCVIGVAAGTFVRPASAVLLPAISRTSRELSVARLWMGYGDGLSVLGAGLLATLLLALEGPALALAGSAVLALISFIIGLLHVPGLPLPVGTAARMRPIHETLSALAALWRVPGTSGVLLVAGGLEVLTGALHILIVVLASDTLDMGRAGAGVLSTFGGIGAALALPVSTVLLGRTGLAPALLVGSGVVALAAIALGVWTTLATALVLLPIMGCSMLVTFLVTRMLLQRSVPPAALAATFGVLELIAGLSQIIGTFAGQALIVLAGPDAALIGLGVFLAVLLVGIRRRVRSADDVSDVPVVAMSLLRRIPAFEPLPATELEAVARGAVEMSVSDGAVVVCEGGRGDCVFGVADGHFDVTMDGELVRTLGRGDGFGEIALLADVARTATVTARGSGTLFRVEREPFLIAVTGHDSSLDAAWRAIRSLRLSAELREAMPNLG